MNSEKKYGIIQQPKPNCPLIDEVINNLRIINGQLSETNPEIVERLINCIYIMENIRDNSILIREWGQEWKSMAKELIDNIEKTRKLYE